MTSNQQQCHDLIRNNVVFFSTAAVFLIIKPEILNYVQFLL